MQIIYSGTFDGLLSAFAYALESPDETFEFASKSESDSSLALFQSLEVQDNQEAADGLLDEIAERRGKKSAMRICRIFLSEEPNIEKYIFAYVKACLDGGPAPEGRLESDDLRAALRISDNVSAEIHRFKGLMRFKRLTDGAFYAQFEPDYDIALPVSFHFRRRLRDQLWIIHDVRRMRAVFWNRTELRILEDYDDASAIQDQSDSCANLWKSYIRNITIAMRKNPRLQRQNMPIRYWKHLTEMN